eukprot:scaffold72937_cov38-Tisochrysis_lutea.AAC.1
MSGVAALASELQLLDQLTKTHRQVHRRGHYFQRVDWVRRAVHAASHALHRRRGALEALDVALQRIPVAWRLLKHLMAQTYFMPYALVHMAILARLAVILAAERAEIAGAGGVPAAGKPPLLCVLAASAAAQGESEQMGSSEPGAPDVSDSFKQQPEPAGVGDDDLGEIVVDVDSVKAVADVSDVGVPAGDRAARDLSHSPGTGQGMVVDLTDRVHALLPQANLPATTETLTWTLDTSATPAVEAVLQADPSPMAEEGVVKMSPESDLSDGTPPSTEEMQPNLDDGGASGKRRRDREEDLSLSTPRDSGPPLHGADVSIECVSGDHDPATRNRPSSNRSFTAFDGVQSTEERRRVAEEPSSVGASLDLDALSYGVEDLVTRADSTRLGTGNIIHDRHYASMDRQPKPRVSHKRRRAAASKFRLRRSGVGYGDLLMLPSLLRWHIAK